MSGPMAEKWVVRKFGNQEPFIDLYTVETPNGYKASIALEELKLSYRYYPISFKSQEQKQAWFIDHVNPNGRIPAIVDKKLNLPIMESGAILLHLAQHYDKDNVIWPKDPVEQSRALQWLFWQVGGLGPMQGQANHFYRYSPEKIPYAIDRYIEETRRLFGVMEIGLQQHKKDGIAQPYLSGKHYSIADIACWTWVNIHGWSGVSELHQWPALKEWFERCATRPALQQGMTIPVASKIREMLQDKEALKKAQDHFQSNFGTKEKL